MKRKNNAQLARRKEAVRKMVAVGLYCHVRNLINAIKAGDITKLSEFQEMVQYLPDNAKIDLLAYMEQ
jgi:hypothetical protein